MASPNVVLLAGPNGAGKSTTATSLLREELAVEEFVNADVIAQGLSAFAPESVAIDAGRLMLARLRELALSRASFAFETTLASRTFAAWLRELIGEGYKFHLVFLWLPSPDLCMARVTVRARMGGHFVPEEVVRRRYESGLRNFFTLYRPLALSWRFYDNSVGRRLLAEFAEGVTHVHDEIWHTIERQYASGRGQRQDR